MLSRSSQFVANAINEAKAAYELAAQADAQTTKLEAQEYPQQVDASMNAIRVFTQAKASSLLQPLVYDEKPAYGTGRHLTDFIIPSLIAMTIFQGAVMGMGRAVAGEKRDGSLTRVFLTPTSNTTIVVGTLLFYIIFEMIRASFLITVAIILFGLKIEGSILLIGLILAIYIGISTAIGMVISSLVHTEQQFISMAMLISLPTMFLSGVFFPIQAMPKAFQVIANYLPITYAGDALRSIMVKGLSFSAIMYPLGILCVFLAVTYVGVIVFFKRDVE